MNFRFLHAADLHIDSPLRGLEDDPEAPAELIRNATRQAFGNLVDLALAEDVAFVLIAGDVYDGDWPDYRTGHFFMNQALRLTRAGKPVFVIHGNHDAANRMTRSLRPPEGMVLFDSRRAHTHELREFGVAIHGHSFAEQRTTANLAQSYPKPLPGLLNIGLLHTAAGRGGHENYAPCTQQQLADQGYDYWALGHVHTREIVSETPWIVFPGNLQGRHANETGEKGASLVSVSAGRIAGVEHRVLDAFRWAHVRVDVAAHGSEPSLLAAVQAALAEAMEQAGQRHLAARVILEGATTLHGALAADPTGLRERVLHEARQVHPKGLWVEDVRLRTRPSLDLATLRERGDGLAMLVGEIEALAADPQPDLLGSFPAELLDKLRRQLPDGHALHEPMGPEIMSRARDLLLAALAAGAGPEV